MHTKNDTSFLSHSEKVIGENSNTSFYDCIDQCEQAISNMKYCYSSTFSGDCLNANIIFNNEYNCAELVAKDRCKCAETIGDTVIETACCDACKDVGVYTLCCCYLNPV